MENEKINKYEKLLFAKYSNFSRTRNCTVNYSPANNANKVGKHSRKYIILISSLFFWFFIQVEYIWLSCFALYCTTLRELIPFAKKLVSNILQEWNFANCARLVFWLLDLRCYSVFVIVRRKVLNIFFVTHISSIHHVQHKDILFILINVKLQIAFISLVWFLLNYN